MRDKVVWADDVPLGLRRLTLSGSVAIGVFVLGFGIWAASAPLAGAAVAPGFVAAAGKNQRVQHLEGGIVDTILVAEGDKVTTGEIVMTLDRTAALAQRDRLEKQFAALSARAARLVAERDGADAVTFPPEAAESGDATRFAGIHAEQEREFDARLQRHAQERVILRQRIASLNEQIVGMQAQQTAIERQLAVIAEETGRKKLLLDKGLTGRSEYTLLLRSEAELVGQQGQSKSAVLGAKTQIVEAEETYARLDTQRVETAASELNDVRIQLSTAEEELRAARAVLERMQIRAPCDGVVVSMLYNSHGSVVRPGEAVLEILPTSDRFVVEAKVSPRDVDAVSVGKSATLRFSALNTRTTPTVAATVSYMSADRLIDPRSEQPYYLARLTITKDLPPEVPADQIFPGMPVEAYIETGGRTFLEYLAKPIVDSFHRGLREE